jgi:hypothetical protein
MRLRAQEAKKMTFEFEATGDPRKHGQPYVAKLVLDSQGRLSREFFNLDRSYGKKTVTVFGSYEVAEGDLIERRDSDGSWKNDDRIIKLALGNKLYTVADPDNSRDMPAVSRYLKTGIVPSEWRRAISDMINRRLERARTVAVFGSFASPLGTVIYAGEPTAYPEVIA